MTKFLVLHYFLSNRRESLMKKTYYVSRCFNARTDNCPHDPVVRQLWADVQRLQADVQHLRSELHELHSFLLANEPLREWSGWHWRWRLQGSWWMLALN